jgi:hypothetical protein
MMHRPLWIAIGIWALTVILLVTVAIVARAAE